MNIRLFVFANFLLIICVQICSCTHYSEVRFVNKIIINNKFPAPDGPVYKTIGNAGYKKAGDAGLYQKKKPVKNRVYSYYLQKYLAVISGSSLVAVVNKRGVDYIIEGRFKEAVILFKDILKDNSSCGAVWNNLGVVYELFGMNKKAFEMYSRACILEPDNSYFRKNFLFRYE